MQKSKKIKRIKEAKDNGVKFNPKEFDNGDTLKRLLTRSRYILAKKEKDWTENQSIRAVILYENYLELKKHIIIEWNLEIFTKLK